MSGTATSIQMTFLKRTGNSYTEYSGVPIASSLNFSTDVRQFSGAFDFEVELALNESFPIRSHDAVEFWFDLDGTKQQIGVGFIEDLCDDSDEKKTDFKANGRELIGQLNSLPFIVNSHFKGQTIEVFTRTALKDTYLRDYLNFRGRTNYTNNQGAYDSPLLVVTNNFLKRGAVLQEYADLAINLIYQNPKGQLEIYGRQQATRPLGILTQASGKSNVRHIRRTNAFSKVISECTVMWATSEQDVDRNNLVSPKVKNTDPRIAHIYQPETKVFSASDLLSLAGQQSASERINSVAKSIIRKSMANVDAFVVNCDEPFYTDPGTGVKTAFRSMQDWHIQDPVKKIDQVSRIAGIAYAQNSSESSIQLAFVDPDSLV